MPLPTLEKTWQYSVNNIISNANGSVEQYRSFWLTFKNQLKTWGWTVIGSSNTTSAAMDGVDRWTGPNDINWANTGSARSWIVLQPPLGGQQLLIDMNTTGQPSGERYAGVYWTNHASGFGGTVSSVTLPTATNTHTLVFDRFITNNTAPPRFVLHMWKSSDNRHFRWLVMYSSVGYMYGGCEYLANTVTNWGDIPLVFWRSQINGGVLNAAEWHSAAYVRTTHGGTNMTMFITGEGATNSLSIARLNVIQNEISGEWPFFPMGVESQTVGKRGRHGRLIDMWWGSQFHMNGTTFPADGTRQFIQVGDVVLPWNGSVPVLY